MQVDYKTLTSHTWQHLGDNICCVCPCSVIQGILLPLLGYPMQTHASVSQTGDAHLGCKHRRTGGKQTMQHCHAFSAAEKPTQLVVSFYLVRFVLLSWLYALDRE